MRGLPTEGQTMGSIGTRSKTSTQTTLFAHGRRLLGRRALLGVGAAVAATAIFITSMALPAQRMILASASADPCPGIEVVFARGTGEAPGVGRVGQAFVDALQPLAGGKSVGTYAVDYPASYDFLRATDGANDASTFVQNFAATCPASRIVLGGYSQGAAVMDLITAATQPMFGFADPMPADVAHHVAAVALFGNPANRIGTNLSPGLTPQYADKTIDLCNGADPVCSAGNDVHAHSLYVQAGLASRAARFAAQKLTGATPPAPTSNVLQDTAAVSSDAGSDGQ
jgi:cutinase